MQIRSQTLQAEYDHVYSGDPALDRTDPGWREKYDRAIELSKFEELPLIPGQKPVLWRLRHLSPEEIAVVQDKGGTNKAILAAARLGLVGVKGLTDDTGAPFKLERASDPRLDGFVAVTKEHTASLHQLDAGDLSPLSVLAELGLKVASTFSPRKG